MTANVCILFSLTLPGVYCYFLQFYSESRGRGRDTTAVVVIKFMIFNLRLSQREWFSRVSLHATMFEQYLARFVANTISL